MKFGVVVFPGSNCDEDMIFALRHNLGQEVVRLWHKDKSTQNCDFLVLPGGFSYGDYLRCGAIARFSPIMEAVQEHARRGGFVLGVCNGFQILTEAHLLPGALLPNENQQFTCKNTYIRIEQEHNPMTPTLPEGTVLKIPVAHADGRFIAQQDVLDKLEGDGQVLFRYCDREGRAVADVNHNGSMNNIAGICNEARNVFGMMPHPERAADPALGNTDGQRLLGAMIHALNLV